jgi:hypothetical protein
VSELNKRLELDIDEILTSPKLRLQLSPAELDKSLLELYDKISQGTSGDLLRVIGGGGAVGMQNLYIKRQATKKRMRQEIPAIDPFPQVEITETTETDRTATQWVQWAMRKNIPMNGERDTTNEKSDKNKKGGMHMSISNPKGPTPGLTSRSCFTPQRKSLRRSSSFSLRI